MRLDKKTILQQKRRWRIRRRVRGTSERPRLSVRFSNRHIHAQIIDDSVGKTIVGLSTLGKDLREQSLRANVAGAGEVGRVLAERAVAAGVKAVVFDRGGRRFHGSLKTFADAAREAGLSF